MDGGAVSDLLNERRLIEEKIWGLRARLSVIQGLTQHGIKHVEAAFFWFQEIERGAAAIPPYVRRAWEEVIVGPTEKPSVRGAESGRFDAGSDEWMRILSIGVGSGRRLR